MIHAENDRTGIRSIRRWLLFFMSFLFLLLLSSPTLGLSAETQLLLSPFAVLAHILIAITLWRLASATGHSGAVWGLIAILLPVVGAILGYLVIGLRARQLEG